MKIINLEIKTKVSKKGNEYTALFAILENGKEIFITFIK